MPAAAAAAAALHARIGRVRRLLRRTAASLRRDEDAAESVHQLRVATRRAVAAIDAFADLLDPRALARARKRLTRLRRAAGGLRDADVALAALLAQRDSAAPGAPEHAALDRLIALTRKQRSRARRRLRKAASRTTRAKLRRARRRLRRALPHAPSPTLRDLADAALDARTEALRSASLRDLRDLANVHQLRIQAKRLRYSLELFAPCFDPAAAADALARLTDLQERLGRINDDSALLARLESAVADIEHQEDSAAAEGLRRLISAQREALTAAHNAFLADWSRGEFAGLIDRLRRLSRLTTPDAQPDVVPPSRIATTQPASPADNGRARPVPGPASADAGPRRFAAIDVGTNSIRLIIAEAHDGDPAAEHDRAYRILDDEKEIARLGRGLDSTGLIDPAAMERAALVVARMKGIAQGYGVRDLRVVGTAVVRDAANGADFARLLRDRAGVELEVISAEEEARLAFLSASSAFDLASTPAAVVDIGGGSTEVVLSAGGVIDRVYTIPLGAVRLTERFGGPERAAGDRFRDLVDEVRRVFRRAIGRPPFVPQVLIGTGGTFTALGNMALCADLGADALGLFSGSVQGHEVRRWEVRHLLERLRKLDPRERERVPGLSPDRADIIVAGLALADGLMKRLEVNRALVHEGGIRDGLLLQMVGGTCSPSRAAPAHQGRDPMRSVLRLARMCGYEHRHCDHVASLATQIFDALASAPSLAEPDLFTPRARLLLHAAAILHDAGYLINYARHHKHSYHIIAHADLPGLTGREIEIVANLARYHRRAAPKRSHAHFARLPSADRRLVTGLAAILRIADGLDRTHTQQVLAVRLDITGREARFIAEADAEPEVDLWGAGRKADLFTRRFGLSPTFAWAGPRPSGPASPDPARVLDAEPVLPPV